MMAITASTTAGNSTSSDSLVNPDRIPKDKHNAARRQVRRLASLKRLHIDQRNEIYMLIFQIDIGLEVMRRLKSDILELDPNYDGPEAEEYQQYIDRTLV